MYSNSKILDIQVRSVPHDKLSFPTVNHPHQVGNYSLSSKGYFRNLECCISIIDKLAESETPFPLKVTEDLIRLDAESCISNIRHLDNMFYFLRSAKNKFLTHNTNNEFVELNTDIVCTREVLQLIMCAPYEYKDDWIITATKYHNTIYICHTENNSTISRSNYLNGLLKKTCIEELRHRCLGVTEDNILHSNSSQQKEDSGQYYCVFSMAICGITLLFDAPILAEDFNSDPLSGTNKAFVDVQLRLETMERAEWLAHNQSDVLKLWVDCFLVGIGNIYLAYLNEKCYVHEIKNITVRELWKECETLWSPNVCANFLARFLAKIKGLMDHVNCASTVYMFEYNANTGNIVYRVNKECNEQSFIPDWFRNMLGEELESLNTEVIYENL